MVNDNTYQGFFNGLFFYFFLDRSIASRYFLVLLPGIFRLIFLILHSLATEQYEPTLTVGNDSVNASYQFDTLLEGLVSKRLIFEVIKPDGTTEEYEHPLLNIHPNYETISVGFGSSTGVAITQFDEVYVAPYRHKDSEVIKKIPEFLSQVSAMNVTDSNDTGPMFNALGYTFHSLLNSFFTENDRYQDLLGDKIMVKPYYDTPRIAAAGMDFSTTNASIYVNLVNVAVDTVPYPDQNPEITKDYRFLMGMTATILESGLLGAQGIGTPNMFVEAGNRSVPILTLENTPEDLTRLNSLGFTDKEKAMMVNEIYAGKSVIVPKQPIDIDGKNYVRWYVVDEEGNTIDWGGEGMHGVNEFLIWVGQRPLKALSISFLILDIVKKLLKFGLIGLVLIVWELIVENIAKIMGISSAGLLYILRYYLETGQIINLVALIKTPVFEVYLIPFTELFILSLTFKDFIAGDPPIKEVHFEVSSGKVKLQLEGEDKSPDGVYVTKDISQLKTIIIQGTTPRFRLIYTPVE